MPVLTPSPCCCSLEPNVPNSQKVSLQQFLRSENHLRKSGSLGKTIEGVAEGGVQVLLGSAS